MRDYCIRHKPETYCKIARRKAKEIFCQMVCQGRGEEFAGHTTYEKQRLNMRWPLNKRQLADKRVVSVIIPCIKEDCQYLGRTIDSLYKNAAGPIEIIIAYDGFQPDSQLLDTRHVAFVPMVGQRVAMTQMVDMAIGEFIFRIDAHCAMSEDWDARMKGPCHEKTIVAADIDRLNKETWEGEGFDAGIWVIDENMKLEMIRNVCGRTLKAEVMTTMGQAFMIRKEYYLACGGCDEELGPYGDMGLEWSLKTWLVDGRTVIKRDVVCCHLFRPGENVVKIDKDSRIFSSNKLYKQWVLGHDPKVRKPFWWLLNKFQHYKKWSKDAKLRLQMHLLSPHIRENYFLDEDTQDEMPKMSGKDGDCAVAV